MRVRSAPTPRSVAFRREREGAWRELESLLDQIESKGLRSLDAEEARRLPVLYRGALSALSVARATALDQALLRYLEALSKRAYVAVYAAKRPLLDAFLEFFSDWFPRAMRQARWPLLIAALTLSAGVATGFLLTLDDMDRYYTLMPSAQSQGRTPAADTEHLRSVLYDGDETTDDALAGFAGFLFQHNARIGLMAFALGFLAGIPVFWLLFYNGLGLGAFAALYHTRGLSLDLWGWLLPHGITELGAIVVCGAAGLILGHALLFPGRSTRMDSLRRAGHLAGGLAAASLVMFLIAAGIEGFFRQRVTDLGVRYAVAIGSALLWAAYLGLVGRPGDREHSGRA